MRNPLPSGLPERELEREVLTQHYTAKIYPSVMLIGCGCQITCYRVRAPLLLLLFYLLFLFCFRKIEQIYRCCCYCRSKKVCPSVTSFLHASRLRAPRFSKNFRCQKKAADGRTEGRRSIVHVYICVYRRAFAKTLSVKFKLIKFGGARLNDATALSIVETRAYVEALRVRKKVDYAIKK